jgi:CBS domain-containing protein
VAFVLQGINSTRDVSGDPGGTPASNKGLRGTTPIMERTRVEEILQPYQGGVPLQPSVNVGDKITHAIELMVRNNVKCIAVLRNQRPVGMVRLEDAFRKIGLHLP